MKKFQKPLVSVIMPVHNAGYFLVEALDSLVKQTYINWELIAVDDFSTDDSLKILNHWASKDKRIKVFKNKKRLGISATANFAMSKAHGTLIARMDADDIALPKRFEYQVEFLAGYPKVVAVGGQCALINATGSIIGYKLFPLTTERIKKMIFYSIPLQQPSVMVNRGLLPKNFEWYDSNFNVAEEVELLFKLFKYGKVCNLSEILLKYRIHGQNTSLVDPKRTFFLTLKTRMKAIVKYGYFPGVKAIFYNLLQTIAIFILPGKAIYPLYAFVRGLRKPNQLLPGFNFNNLELEY